MKADIPFNPKVLKWARKSAGLHTVEVAKKMKKPERTIVAWEQGEASPTYVQLETLAYKVYKRPLAIFFFPEPPEEETPAQSLRTLPEHEIETMSYHMRYLLKKARAMQINLAELNFGINPAKRNIVREVHFDPDDSVSTMVGKVRDYLKIDLDTQFGWSNADEALKAWRHSLETKGLFIFKEAFKDDNFSGFCYHDTEFPLIYINNSQSKTRQIFSIFHELAHLLLGTGGVDARRDTFIKGLAGKDRKIEVLCNRFAGAFLAPDSDFDDRIVSDTVSDTLIFSLAERYKVSREVILRKFLDRRMIDSAYYSNAVESWGVGEQFRSSGSGGDYYATKGVYLGGRYLELVFGCYYRKRIDRNQLAGYLDVKVKHIPGMEALLCKKGFV